MINDSTITRRHFLDQGFKAVTAFSIVPVHVLGGRRHTPPSEQLTKGIIGVGGMGKGHIGYGNTRCLAVCDVDENHVKDATQKAGKDCMGYRDFREVLGREDIDIIHVPTPPHWHALISIAAAESGKDIWCEKPMTRFISEGQHVMDAVQRNGRMFRINTWFRFGDYYGYGTSKQIKKLCSSGLLGHPLTVHLSPATGFNWKVREWSGRTDLVPEKPPAHLDYDLWLGPAPIKPYHPHRVHGSFRGYWDYDGGGLSDMGQHYLDPIQYFLDKDDTSPVWIEAHAPWPTHPDAVGLWGWVEMTYADGCKLILESGEWGELRSEKNIPLIEGPKGKLYRGFKTDPPGLARELDAFPDPAPMVDDFVESVRTRRKFGLNEVNANRSSILVHLANAAIRTGRRLQFDPKTQRFINDEDANRLANVPMRAPWNLPGGSL